MVNVVLETMFLMCEFSIINIELLAIHLTKQLWGRVGYSFGPPPMSKPWLGGGGGGGEVKEERWRVGGGVEEERG